MTASKAEAGVRPRDPSPPVDPDAPIGVFDSGVGGLSVLQRLRSALPHEDFIYLGDTARVPYGTKSPQTVARYASTIAADLRARGCKALVIACNTASAFGLEAAREVFGGPVVDVIEPVASVVAQESPSGRIGILGTGGTVRSGAYPTALRAGGRELHVAQVACPLFVPLAEEGWTHGEVPRLVAEQYLQALARDEQLDTVILGCTHYPLLREVIQAAFDAHSPAPPLLQESGRHTAARLVLELDLAGLASRREHNGRVSYLVSDDPEGFRVVGERLFGEPLPEATHVDLR